jgi:hypothetical protein
LAKPSSAWTGFCTQPPEDPVQHPAVTHARDATRLVRITDHSKSVRSKRAIHPSIAGKKESLFALNGNPFYGYVT